MENVIELIRSTGDGAFAIDRLQRIVFWNNACEDILGYDAREAVGRACFEIIGGTADDGCLICDSNCAAMQARRRGKRVPTRQLRVTHKDGSLRWLSTSTIMVPSAWSQLSVLIHLIRDVTTHKRIEKLVDELSGKVAEITAETSDAENGPKEPGATPITEREREVLSVMSTGSTTPEIATRLNISHATTRNHIHNIITKLGVRNRLEAVVMALRTGVL